MPDKDVDEQFAAIMAHWDDVALGLDPFGDPLADEGTTSPSSPDSSDGSDSSDDSVAAAHPAEPAGDAAPAPVADDGARSTVPEATTEPTAPTDGAIGATAGPTKDPTTPPSPPAAPASGRVPPRPTPERLPADDAPPVIGSGWRQHDPPEVEEHFVPPPPAPLPSADDKHFWLMMVGLIGGPLLFLYLILFDRDGNGWWMMFSLGMAIAGFVLLVLRQPAERDENDDGVRL